MSSEEIIFIPHLLSTMTFSMKKIDLKPLWWNDVSAMPHFLSNISSNIITVLAVTLQRAPWVPKNTKSTFQVSLSQHATYHMYDVCHIINFHVLCYLLCVLLSLGHVNLSSMCHLYEDRSFRLYFAMIFNVIKKWLGCKICIIYCSLKNFHPPESVYHGSYLNIKPH